MKIISIIKIKLGLKQVKETIYIGFIASCCIKYFFLLDYKI